MTSPLRSDIPLVPGTQSVNKVTQISPTTSCNRYFGGSNNRPLATNEKDDDDDDDDDINSIKRLSFGSTTSGI